MEMTPIILIGFIVVGVIALRSYSVLLKLYNNVRDTYVILDLYFKKRWDFITVFIQYIERFIVDDKTLINELKDLHSGVYEGLSRKRKFALNSKFSLNLKRLIEQCLQIEELKDEDLFKRYCEEIMQVEKRISECKKNYNSAVYKFHEKIEVFPHYIVGGMMKLGEYDICS